MKKISTVAAKASKKISQPKLTVGLDLGDRNSWYCVLDESGQIQREQHVRTMRQRCAKSSGRCRAAGSRWRSDAFALDQSLAPRVGA